MATVKELKERAKELGIKKSSTMKKAELEKAIARAEKKAEKAAAKETTAEVVSLDEVARDVPKKASEANAEAAPASAEVEEAPEEEAADEGTETAEVAQPVDESVEDTGTPTLDFLVCLDSDGKEVVVVKSDSATGEKFLSDVYGAPCDCAGLTCHILGAHQNGLVCIPGKPISGIVVEAEKLFNRTPAGFHVSVNGVVKFA